MEKKMPLYEVDKTWWKEVLENEDMLLFSEMSQRRIEHVVVLTSLICTMYYGLEFQWLETLIRSSFSGL